MLKGQLYKGMDSRRLGHLEATLEVASYMVCTYPFEIGPGKGILGSGGGDGWKSFLLLSETKPGLNDYGAKVIYAVMFLNCELFKLSCSFLCHFK